MAKFEALKFTKECAEQAFAKETSRKLSASVENFNDPTQRLTSLGPRHVCQDLIFAAARNVREKLCYERHDKCESSIMKISLFFN